MTPLEPSIEEEISVPNEQLMNDCVARIRQENPDFTASRARAICKASLGFNKKEKRPKL